MLRYPDPGWVYKIKFIIFFFTLPSMFELFNDKIDHIKEKLLLSLSSSLRLTFFILLIMY